MKKTVYYAFKTLLHNKVMSLIKIVSIGVGLAMCMLLFTRIAFEKSYDTAFAGHERLYQLWMQWRFNGEFIQPNQVCVGALAGGVLQEMSDAVESATSVFGSLHFPLYADGKRHDATKIVADSLFFNTLGITVLKGNPVADLVQRDVVYLSDVLSRQMFGDTDPTGRTISYNNSIPLIVKGVYRALPANTSLRPDAVISMPTVLSRGRDEGFGYNYSWHGGDSWLTYIRLKPQADGDQDNLSARINEVVKRHVPEDSDLFFRVLARNITETHTSDDNVARMISIMTVLAVALLAITSLNYVLISISSLARRSKGVGVHKCVGARDSSIFAMFMWETALIVAGALVVVVLLLFNFRVLIEETMDTGLTDLFAVGRLWIAGVVVLALFAVGGILPGRMFAGIPVTQVMHRFAERRTVWKRSLLAVEFAGVAFICGLLGIMMAQYSYITGKDKGYDSAMLAYGRNIAGDSIAAEAFRAFYEGLPYVDAVSSSQYDPVGGYPGNFASGEGGIFFSSRWDVAESNYPGVMGMKIYSGRAPENESEMMVNREFLRLMHLDERTVLTEHPRLDFHFGNTIVGVLEDFNIGGFYYDTMPFVLLYASGPGNLTWLRLKDPFDENLRRLNADMREAYPGTDNEFISFDKTVADNYHGVKIFRNATLMAAIAVALITLMGLIGFVNDEIQRRAKEIAIRKVNGAEASHIIRLMSRDVMLTAIPSVVAGSALAWWAGDTWLCQFVVSTSTVWLYPVVTGMAVLLVVSGCVVVMSRSTAQENPSINLKSE